MLRMIKWFDYCGLDSDVEIRIFKDEQIAIKLCESLLNRAKQEIYI